jgi:hypothetical protein
MKPWDFSCRSFRPSGKGLPYCLLTPGSPGGRWRHTFLVSLSLGVIVMFSRHGWFLLASSRAGGAGVTVLCGLAGRRVPCACDKHGDCGGDSPASHDGRSFSRVEVLARLGPSARPVTTNAESPPAPPDGSLSRRAGPPPPSHDRGQLLGRVVPRHGGAGRHDRSMGATGCLWPAPRCQFRIS